MGWLPLNGFSRDDMGPFHPDVRPHFGPIGVMIGFFAWSFFGMILASMSIASFQKQTNRVSDGITQFGRREEQTKSPEY